jgi:hypothetical protein
MNPIIQRCWTPEERAHYGIRGIEDFTPEELAVLQWMRQRAPHPGSTRDRTPFVRKRRPAAPA